MFPLVLLGLGAAVVGAVVAATPDKSQKEAELARRRREYDEAHAAEMRKYFLSERIRDLELDLAMEAQRMRKESSKRELFQQNLEELQNLRRSLKEEQKKFFADYQRAFSSWTDGKHKTPLEKVRILKELDERKSQAKALEQKIRDFDLRIETAIAELDCFQLSCGNYRLAEREAEIRELKSQLRKLEGGFWENLFG